jgi:hypothetical protein
MPTFTATADVPKRRTMVGKLVAMMVASRFSIKQHARSQQRHGKRMPAQCGRIKGHGRCIAQAIMIPRSQISSKDASFSLPLKSDLISHNGFTS